MFGKNHSDTAKKKLHKAFYKPISKESIVEASSKYTSKLQICSYLKCDIRKLNKLLKEYNIDIKGMRGKYIHTKNKTQNVAKQEN